MVRNPIFPPSATAVEREVNGERVLVPIVNSPTEMERLSAQVLFTAVMTDTLIEEEEEVEPDV